MFCVLTVNNRRESLFERAFHVSYGDEYILRCVPVISGAPFYHLTARVGKNGVDFDRVLFEVGRCAGRLLVDNAAVIPENRDGIGKFESDLLYNKITDNTLNLLRQKANGRAKTYNYKRIISVDGDIIEIGADKNGFTLPQRYLSLMPQGVELYDFAAALYELCGVFSIGDAVFDSILINGEKKSIVNLDFA